MNVVDQARIDAWLPRLGGPGFTSDNDRNEAILEMRAAGNQAVFPHLVAMLSEDVEARCTSCEAILRVDAHRGLELVLPLLNDPDSYVRWFACERLGVNGDERAVPAFLSLLKSDPDPGVRCSAVRGLGSHGAPGAIPAILSALETDHETDSMGYSPSFCAAAALDDLLGTNMTRLKIGNTCRLLDHEPDLVGLKRIAEARYQEWLKAAST